MRTRAERLDRQVELTCIAAITPAIAPKLIRMRMNPWHFALPLLYDHLIYNEDASHSWSLRIWSHFGDGSTEALRLEGYSINRCSGVKVTDLAVFGSE